MINKLNLSDGEFAEAAESLGCDINAVRAVAEVESSGSGFIPDGRATILYEAHIFGRLTKNAHKDAKDSCGVALSATKWDRTLYGAPGAHQHERLTQAMGYDSEAALQACSWGAFQVMGMHWRTLGYASVGEFVTAMNTPQGQLDAFVRFIKANYLQQALKMHHWAQFAMRYNGPSYTENHYDTKLEAAYARFRKEEKDGPR